MNLKIHWTEEAIETFQQNITYLENNWGEKVIINFLEKAEKCIEVIEKSPDLFPIVDKKKKVHRCPVVRQITLFYKIKEEQIDLVTFWNNYRNPKKLKFK